MNVYRSTDYIVQKLHTSEAIVQSCSVKKVFLKTPVPESLC